MITVENSKTSGSFLEKTPDAKTHEIANSSQKWKKLSIKNNMSEITNNLPPTELVQPPPTQQKSSQKNGQKSNTNISPISNDSKKLSRAQLDNSDEINQHRKLSKENVVLSPEELRKKQRLDELRKKIVAKEKSKGVVGKKETKEGFAKILANSLTKWWKESKFICCKKFKNQKNQNIKKQNISSIMEQNSPSSRFQKNSTDNIDGTSANQSKNNSFSSSGVKDGQKQKMKMPNNIRKQTSAEKDNEILQTILKDMSKENIFEKAYRHLIDGLLYRNVRHDLDGEGRSLKFVRIIWRLQNSSLWNDLLLMLGWVYIFMSFFEPFNRMDESLPELSFTIMVTLEIFILSLQTIDLVFELIQRSTQNLIYYVYKYPVNTFRFARAIRPLQIIIFSKQLRRSFQGIINSGKHLLMILMLYIVITIFFAYIGTTMLGDLYNQDGLDTYAVDFRDFLKAANAMYIFSSLDLYPDILFPAVQSSYLYLMYFLPYLLMFLFLFAPIPTAVVYDGYRRHRLNLLIADRVKRRKALWACFQCIVSNRKKSYISQEDFIEFFKFAYGKVELEDAAEVLAEILWEELDENNNKKASIDEFFSLIDITEQRQDLRIQRIKPLKKWVEFREYIENTYSLESFINGKTFEYLSFLVTIGSCITTIINLFSDTTSPIVDGFDKFFFAFFCLEILLKMIAFGPDGYFGVSWNVFDFSLVCFQIFFDYIFYSIMSGSSVKSVGASRVLKIAKLQKVFRMFRALRTAKILNYIFQGLDLIQKVYEMLYKIFICIPIVMKLSIIIIIFIYIYAVIGVELFAVNLVDQLGSTVYGQNMCAPETNADDYTYCEYATFDSFGGALLILLQVCVGSGWSYIQFDYSKKFDDMVASSFYFNSFHFFAVFVLSLIGGLIWEVFDVVERIMRDKQAYEEQLRIHLEWEEQQQQLESSFQSFADTSKKSVAQINGKGSFRHSVAQSMLNMKKHSTQHQIKMKLSSQINSFDIKQQEDDGDDDSDNDNEGEDGKATKQQTQNNNGNDTQKQNNSFMKASSLAQKITNQSTKFCNPEEVKLSIGKLEFQIESDDSDEEEEDTDNSLDDDDDNEEDQEEEENTVNEQQSQDGVNYFPTFNQRMNSGQKKNQHYDGQQSDISPIVKGNICKKEENQDISPNETTTPWIQLHKIDSKEIRHTSENTIEKQSGQMLDGIRKVQSYSEQIIDTQGEQFTGSRVSLMYKLSQNQQARQMSDRDTIRQEQRRKTKKKTVGGLSPIRIKSNVTSKRNSKAEKKEWEKQMSEQIFTENEAMTQREKGQMILHQDRFKMSTLDSFFRNRNLLCIEPADEIKPPTIEAILEEEEEDLGHREKGQNKQKDSIWKRAHLNQKKTLLKQEKDIKQESQEQININNEIKQHTNETIKKQESNLVLQEQEGDNNEQQQYVNISILQEDIEEHPERVLSDLDSKLDQDFFSGKDNKLQKNSEKIINSRHEPSKTFKVLSIDDVHKISKTQSEQYISNHNDIPLSDGNKLYQIRKRGNLGFGEQMRNQFKQKEQYSTSDRSPAENNLIVSGNCCSSEFTFPVSEYFPSRTLHEANGKKNLEQADNSMVEEDLSPIYQKEQMTEEFFIKPEKFQMQYTDDMMDFDSKKSKTKRQNSQEYDGNDNMTSNPLETSSKAAGNQREWQSFMLPSQVDEPILGQKFTNCAEQQQHNNENELNSSNISGQRQKIKEQGKDNENKNNQDQIKLKKEEICYNKTTNQAIEEHKGLGKQLLLAVGNEPRPSQTQLNPSECVSARDDAPNIIRNNPTLHLFQGVNQENSIQIQPILRQEEAPISECMEDLLNPESILFQNSNDKTIDKEVSPKQAAIIASIKRKEERAERNLKKRILKEKHRLEMEKLFATNLLDVELQGGSLNQTAQNPLLAMIAMSQKPKHSQKSDQRDLIQDLPKNKLLRNHILNINQSLKYEQSTTIRVDLSNMNYILNKAILKQINPEKVKNIEMRHFKHLYGSQFEDFLEEDVSPLWKEQAMLLFQFNNIFKFIHFPIEQFIQMYCSLEMQLSALIMNKFSSIKIIYQDQENQWFTVNYIQESYFLQEVPKEGPWSFFEKLFENRPDSHRLLKHRNIYSINDKSDYAKKYLQTSFTISQNISNNFYFRQLQFNQKRSDVVYIPIINENTDQTRKKTLDVMQFSKDNLPEYIRKEDLVLDQIPYIKRALVVAHLFDNPSQKSRKSKVDTDTLNIEQAVIEEDMLAEEMKNATLNYTYSIELLKDIRHHLNSNKDNLFTKISQFYFYRYCFEKNFQDMQQVPFE